MNNCNPKSFKNALPMIFLCLLCTTSRGQKLPRVQVDGSRAPAGVRTDGKATEWKSFAAFNDHTQTFYTLANDDSYLYLAIQVKDMEVINRMLSGGLTLIVQKSADKKDKDKITVTYPGDHLNTTFSQPTNLDRPDKGAGAADSITRSRNQVLETRCKTIEVTGIRNVESQLSVYNENGIRAAGLFKDPKTYEMEIAVPLTLLHLSIDGQQKFTYSIRVNGSKEDLTPPGDLSPGLLAIIAQHNAMRAATTDFWGEYTLVKN